MDEEIQQTRATLPEYTDLLPDTLKEVFICRPE